MFERHTRWPLISMLFVLACVGLIPAGMDAALAHNVTVFAWVEGDTVHVESKFSGGRRPQNAPIEVYDPAGRLLLSGQTDSEGAFSFTAPQQTDLKIVLQAGMGHRAEWTVRAGELAQISASPSSAVAGAKPPASPGPSENKSSTGPYERDAASAGGGLTADQVQDLVEKALDRKLKPVMKLLSESRPSGPTISDILGGLGYILGLVGLGAYIQFKRSQRPKKPQTGKDPS